MYIDHLPKYRLDYWFVGTPTLGQRLKLTYSTAPRWLRLLCNLPLYLGAIALYVLTVSYCWDAMCSEELSFRGAVGVVVGMFGGIGLLLSSAYCIADWCTHTRHNVFDFWDSVVTWRLAKFNSPRLIRISRSVVFGMMKSRDRYYREWSGFDVAQWLADHPQYKQTIDGLLTDLRVVKCVNFLETFKAATKEDEARLEACRQELKRRVQTVVDALDDASDQEQAARQAKLDELVAAEEAQRRAEEAVAKQREAAEQAARRKELDALISEITDFNDTRQQIVARPDQAA